MENNKKSNAFIDLIFNVIIPALVLSKFSDGLGQLNAFVLALSFPLFYGIFDLIKRKNINWFSAIGLVNVLITGGLGLMKIDGFWFAVKEALIPSIIGIAVLASVKFKPLVKVILYNDKVMHIDKVNAILTEKNAHKDFDKLLINTNYLLASSFFLSAILNFFLARIILKSPGGTIEFNHELGKMHALSLPVIAIPSGIIMTITIIKLIKGIKKITGLEIEEVIKSK